MGAGFLAGGAVGFLAGTAAAGVGCDTVCETNDHPYDSIIKTAEGTACDLIVLHSHGRKGLAGVLLGSETQKVLTHSRIPVLVHR